MFLQSSVQSFMLHGVICRKTAIFIVHAVRTSKLRQRTTPDYGNTRKRTAKHSSARSVSTSQQTHNASITKIN